MERIGSSLAPGECLACWIMRSNARYVLHAGAHTTVLLSEYPRTWGQTMVLLNPHKTSISETTKEEWDELAGAARMTALVLERELAPLRCYISSLGATENLPNTCPHLHFNVLPIYNSTDRPSDIFTWRDGLYAGEESEWADLFGRLARAWTRLASGTMG